MMKIKHNVTFQILYTQPMVRSRYQRLLTIMRVPFKIGKGSFNNYVDKKRVVGVSKNSTLVHPG